MSYIVHIFGNMWILYVFLFPFKAKKWNSILSQEESEMIFKIFRKYSRLNWVYIFKKHDQG